MFINFIELTTSNILKLLEDSGFDYVANWFKLGEHLGVPVRERPAEEREDKIFAALKEVIDWWITNHCQPSWEELISSVERCDESNAANSMRRQLMQYQKGSKLDYVPHILSLIKCIHVIMHVCVVCVHM